MKSKILLVTGREAASLVKKYSSRVHVCPVDVAALLSLPALERELGKLDLSKYSLVLVPGLVTGDTNQLSTKLNIPVYKGTKHVSELPLLLKYIDDIELSNTLPADNLLQNYLIDDARVKIEKAYSSKKSILEIGSKNKLLVGGLRPMQVVAEIENAPNLSDEELKKQAVYLVESGAKIIDLGFLAGVDNSSKINSLINSVRSVVDVPISVDSMNEKEILAAVESGVDLILSIGENNLSIVDSIDVPFVLVPVDSKGSLPSKSEDRVKKLESLMSKISSKKVILDPVLSPLNHGFMESLKSFSTLKSSYPKIPFLMGIGNVTELLDADSVGVNATLAGLASELNIELLFTVEASPKTRGSVKELVTASEMMYLAKTQNKSPKDLGLDLLKLKNKREPEVHKGEHDLKIKPIKAVNKPPTLEPTSFIIELIDNNIHVFEFKSNELTMSYTGNNAESLYKTVCSKTELGSEHAAYLGKELMKAEIALILGKNYIQDEELF